jgi:hypothetical protein
MGKAYLPLEFDIWQDAQVDWGEVKWTPKIRQKKGQKIDKIMPCKNIIPENKKLKSYWKC